MPLVFACIAPHGSIAIPEAKPKDRPSLASATTAGMQELGRRFAAAQPDVSIVLTPHNIHIEGTMAVIDAAAVVLDIGLPDYDGTQFVARWRERRPDAGDVPIVIVSGRADRREIASLLGAAYVCGKPFIVDELVDQVERAVLH